MMSFRRDAPFSLFSKLVCDKFITKFDIFLSSDILRRNCFYYLYLNQNKPLRQTITNNGKIFSQSPSQFDVLSVNDATARLLTLVKQAETLARD